MATYLGTTINESPTIVAVSYTHLIGKRKNGRYVVANVTNVRLAAGDVRKHIKNTCLLYTSRCV